MLVKISRILLILLVVTISSIILPYYYWISFGERVIPPMVRYSPVIEKFIIGHYDGKLYQYSDTDNKQYTRDETDLLLPFVNYRLLAAKEMMPDSLQGVKIELEEVRRNGIFQRIKPYSIDPPKIPLAPLFESKPPRLKLELPSSFFRITDRMEFIDAESNTIDQELSDTFNKALTENNFKFPAKEFFGNPSTRKPFDEGYFVIDSENQMFHVKMVHGQPFCKNTNKPADVNVKSMFVSEHDLREYYGVMITQDDELYLVMYDNYRLQKLPIEQYSSKEQQVVLIGNMFYRVFVLVAENNLKAYVLDRDYNLVDRYQESWEGSEEQMAGVISDYIFPFTIALHSNESSFVNFYTSTYSYLAIFANILFVLLTILVKRKRETAFARKWYDLLLVLVTGVYGFIAMIIFENTDSK